jgi:class 3 adenylate cyclase/predicted ATPase
MRCPKCGTESLPAKQFCAECGSPLPIKCPNCGADTPANAKFCADCGAALAGIARPSSGSPANISATTKEIRITPEQGEAVRTVDGERKTITALFADIKGSTELMRELDPEEARAILDPVLQLMMHAVHRYDGYVAQSTGDGIFAMFGAPVAHEDHPQRALHAALAIQQDLHDYRERLKDHTQPHLEARIGVNTGEVVLRTVNTGSHTEYSPVGHAANLAARMQTVASAGSVVITEACRRLVEGYFSLRALGTTEIKGISEPVNVYEVIGPGALRGHFELAAQRGLTRFVGRERELAELGRALELAISGHGQIVAVVADAGTGKSRLVYEFKVTILAKCKLVEAYSVSHGKASPWLPVLELLRSYFGLKDVDDAVARREKIRASLTALDPALSDAAPYLWNLLAIQEEFDPLAQMDAQIKHQRTLDAIKQIILRESLNQPVVIVFEDLHWIDIETQALLDLLADSIANARVLMAVNYRPEYRHEWGNKSNYSQLRLETLTNAAAREMLATLLGENAELDPLKRTIIERTQGNPFFIEEMLEALFDQGALARNGVVTITRPLAQVRLPPTVQGILAARIDRQPAEHKQLLQALAVIGRQSGLSLIKRVVPTTEPQLQRMLLELQASEFIYEQLAFTDREYVFKHALTQEVAYNSMLIERRKVIHERVGQVLESLFADQLDDHVSELAHHYSSSDDNSKAIDYLTRAGQQALQRCAPTDATNNFSAAISLLPKLPNDAETIQRELPLQMSLGYAFILLKGWAAAEVERAFNRVLDICPHVDNPPEVFFALFGLNQNSHVRGDYGATRERSQQLLSLAERAGDHTQLVLAHYAMGEMSLHVGDFELARRHYNSLLALYDELRDRPLAFRLGTDAKQGILSYLAWDLWLLGYPDQAVAIGKQAIAVAQKLSHPFSVASAEFFLNIVHMNRREAATVQSNAERIIAFCSEHGFGAWLLFSTTHRGWAIAEQGHPEEGIELMRQGLATAHGAGADIGRPDRLCRLAEGYMKAGRVNETLGTLNEALSAVDQQEEHYYEAEIYRLKGEAVLRQDHSNIDEAEECFRRAIGIAHNQSGKSLELRAATSLARLLASNGSQGEVRTILAEIYGWFTEGFDTADLKDAKALLDELSA